MKHPCPMRTARCAAARRLAWSAWCWSPAPTEAAGGYVPISGAGSTWSQVAIDAWRADVRASGVVVNFTGTGSTDGRSQYIQGTVDFANTEIPFQNPPEPGQQAEVPSRPYAYLPIVAGGTSFMYNLTVGGQAGQRPAAVRRRRWPRSSPVRSRAGTTRRSPRTTASRCRASRSSRWCAPTAPAPRPSSPCTWRSQAPSIYCPFIRSKLHLGGCGCPSVSFYPAFGNSKAQNGSNGVANYVSAAYGAGAIGYVEYAYAKRIDFPVGQPAEQGRATSRSPPPATWRWR